MNYFPGYDGVPDFWSKLTMHIIDRAMGNSARQKKAVCDSA